MSTASSSSEPESDSDDCDMGPWESLPIESMMVALSIQRTEGEVRHQKYHDKLARLKERQENLLQRKVARLKQDGINIDIEALKRRSKPRRKRSAWAGDDDDDHKRHGKQKAMDHSDEESDDMYEDSDEGSEEENQEPRDYAEWYARQYGFGSESPRRKSAGSKSKQKKTKKTRNVKMANTAGGTVRVVTFRAVRNVISATNYLERKSLARKAQPEGEAEAKPPDFVAEPANPTEPSIQADTPRMNVKDAKQKLKKANLKLGATVAFNDSRARRRPLGAKKPGT